LILNFLKIPWKLITFFRSSSRDEAESKLELRLNAKVKLRLWLNFWQQNSAIAMNVVVTSHLPVCLYSAAGKKVNHQDFYTGQTPTERWAAKTEKVNLHGGTALCSEIVSFLGNELREGVFGPSSSRSLRDFFHGSSSLRKTI
jgi:hypothetical protein